jgi:hypothetical protein
MKEVVMTKPDYRAPVEGGSKGLFAEWAARLAVGLPMLAVVSLYCVKYLLVGNENSATYFKWYLWGMMAVLGAAVVLGIVALTGIKKRGPEGILLPSCIGIGLSLLLGGYMWYTGSFTSPAERLTQQMVGEWQMKGQVVNGPAVEQRLALRADGSATVTATVGQQTQSMTGQWKVLWDGSAKPAGLIIGWDPGNDPKLGKGALWLVVDLKADRLTLEVREGDRARRDTFERIGK